MNQVVAREDLESLLRWYVDQGIDEAIGEDAIDRFAAPAPQPTPLPVQQRVPAAPTPNRPSLSRTRGCWRNTATASKSSRRPCAPSRAARSSARQRTPCSPMVWPVR